MSDILKKEISELVNKINEKNISDLYFNDFIHYFSHEKSNFDIILSTLGFDFDIQNSLRSINKNASAITSFTGFLNFLTNIAEELKENYDDKKDPHILLKIFNFAKDLNELSNTILNESEDNTDTNLFDTAVAAGSKLIDVFISLSEVVSGMTNYKDLSDVTQQFFKKIPLIGNVVSVVDFYIEAEDISVPILNKSVADQGVDKLDEYINDFYIEIQNKTNGTINKNEIMLKNYFSYFKEKYGDILNDDIQKVEKLFVKHEKLNSIFLDFNNLTKSLQEYKNFLISFDDHPDYKYKKTEKEKILQVLTIEIDEGLPEIYSNINDLDFSDFQDDTPGYSFHDWFNNANKEDIISELLTKMKNFEVESIISENIDSYFVNNDFWEEFVITNEMDEILADYSKIISESYSSIFNDFFISNKTKDMFYLTIDEVNNLILEPNDGFAPGLGGTLDLNEWLFAIDNKITNKTKESLDFIKNETKADTDAILNEMLNEILVKEAEIIINKEYKTFYILDDYPLTEESNFSKFILNEVDNYNNKLSNKLSEFDSTYINNILGSFNNNFIDNSNVLRDQLFSDIALEPAIEYKMEILNNIYQEAGFALDKIKTPIRQLGTIYEDFFSTMIDTLDITLHSEDAFNRLEQLSNSLNSEFDLFMETDFNSIESVQEYFNNFNDARFTIMNHSKTPDSFESLFLNGYIDDYSKAENEYLNSIDLILDEIFKKYENDFDYFTSDEFYTKESLRYDEDQNGETNITDPILILLDENEITFTNKNIITDISLLNESDFDNLYFWNDKDGDGRHKNKDNSYDINEIINVKDYGLNNFELLKNNLFNIGNDIFLGTDIYFGSEKNDNVNDKTINDFDLREGDDHLSSSKYNDYILGKDGNDVIHSNDGQDIVYGGDGDDELYGGNGADILNGGDGDDLIGKHYGGDYYGSDHAPITEDIGDFIHGGKGNDTIYDTYHSDVITFNLGDGNDTLHLSDALENNEKSKDVIRFGEGISKNDIQFERIESNSGHFDLKIIINENDSILLKDWFKNNTSAHKVESFEFSNGETLSWLDIHNEFGLNKENPNGSTINGNHNYDDILIGTDGHDYIYGLSGNNELHGGDGNDYLKGHYTNGYQGGSYIWADKTDRYLNKYYGGKGNDTIEASVYTEEIYYNLGDGHDTLILTESSRRKDESKSNDWTHKDKLIFGAGISVNNLSYYRNGNDFIIKINERTDKIDSENDGSITIKDFYEGRKDVAKYTHTIEEYIFEDGTIFTDVDMWEKADSDKVLNLENPSVKVISERNIDGEIIGTDNNDILSGNKESTTFDGGKGNDILNDLTVKSEEGSLNKFIAGQGDDSIYLSNSNNEVYYNSGDGHDVVNFNKESESNKIIFGELIQKEDLTFKIRGQSLIIQHGNGSLTLTNWFEHSDVDLFSFDNGDTLTANEITNIAIEQSKIGTDGEDFLYGQENSDDIMFGKGDDDLIRGLSGDDTLHGENGYDDLYGGEGNDTLYGGIQNDKLYGGTENDTLHGGEHNDKLYGEDGEDTLNGDNGNDTLDGGFGIDTLNGGDGDDILGGERYSDDYYGNKSGWIDDVYHDVYNFDSGNIYNGGKGNDTINDTIHSDTIIYNLGDGHDTLNMDYRSETESSNSKGKDILVLGAGITLSDLSFEKLNEDLVIKISEGTENEGSITIKQYFYQAFQSSYKIEEIQFNDGSVMSWENIVNLILEDTGYVGTDNNDYIRGFENADNNIDGANGDDQIYGGNLNDNILGSDGNDQLHGGYGNDILNGGAGNDTLGQSYSSDRYLSDDFTQGNTLIGGTGDDTIYDTDSNDTIIYNLGDGHDTLNLSYRSDFDILKFGENIQKSDLIFEVNNKNLVIKIATGTEDEGSITIENWFGDLNNSFSKIEEVLFSDGTKLNWEIITQTALDNGYTDHQGSELSEHIYGFENINNNIYGNDGDDTIYGKNLDDYIDGGNGNDILNGGYGKDTLIGGNGNDLLGNKNQDEDYQGNDGRNENGEFIGYEATDSGNIYEGGEGDDVIYDTYHSDIFIYNVGDGSDTYNLTNITENETDTGSKRRDVLRFGEGISLSNLTFSVSGFNLIITAFEGFENEGRLTFSNWFKNLNNSSFKAEVIEFYDGTILSWNDVNNYIDPSDLENLTGNQILNGTNENDNLIGGDDEDTINGLDGDDNITGGFGRDILNGGEGNDTLGESWGEDYNGSPDFDENGEWLNPNLKDNGNVFNGGKGNDIIYDTMHSDTIIYNLGDGHDTIYLSHDTENTSGNGESLKRDILEFGENISLSDLSFEQVNSNLIITIAAGSEHEGSIHLSNWFNSIDSSSNKIEEFKFNDGSVYSWLEIMNIANPNIYYGDENDNVMNGTENNDYLFGLDGQDVIDGGLGDDIIDGGFGKDTLIGGEGNDTLGGTYNNDYQGNNPTLENGEYADILLTDSGNILIGGKGDDIIHDTIHSDTIIYNLGDGHDSLTMAWDAENLSNDGKSLRKDVLEFGENISLSDLSFEKSNSDLIIKVATGTENEGSLHIWNWFNQLNDSSQKIEEIKLNDGTVLSWQEVSAMADDSIIIDFDKDGIINGDEFNNIVIDSKNNDTINSKEGDDIVYIGAGDDFVNTDTGNDKVILQEGNNTVHTGDGNDIVEVWHNAGNNIIKLGDGDDITNLNNKNNTVYLGNGNDTINISGGNDVIYAESGDNQFIFNIWENSNTVINMSEHLTTDNNVIRFGYGISKESLIFDKDGLNLTINVKSQYNPEQVNIITINNWFIPNLNGNHQKIENITFDEYPNESLNFQYIDNYISNLQNKIDGSEQNDTILSLNDVENNINAFDGNDHVQGGNLDDQIYGNQGDDKLEGLDGNDILYGENGNDFLDGGLGKDFLIGGEGNDILGGKKLSNDHLRSMEGNVYNGGKGNDFIDDTKYSDVIYYNLGDGNDIINTSRIASRSLNDRYHDKIIFGENINSSGLGFERSDNDLILYVDKTDKNKGSLLLKNWFVIQRKYSEYKIEEFEFHDGEVLYFKDIEIMAEDYIDIRYSSKIIEDNTYELLLQEMASFGADDEDIDSSGNINTSDPYIYN